MPQGKGAEGERHEKHGPRAVRTPAVLPECAVLHSAPRMGKVCVAGHLIRRWRGTFPSREGESREEGAGDEMPVKKAKRTAKKKSAEKAADGE